MAPKKPAKLASGKPNQVFWKPRRCDICGKPIDTMKEAERVLSKVFAGARAATNFIWRHKVGCNA